MVLGRRDGIFPSQASLDTCHVIAIGNFESLDESRCSGAGNAYILIQDEYYRLARAMITRSSMVCTVVTI